MQASATGPSSGAVLACPPGVFWIDWKSVCHFFDVTYINWKPKLFDHKSTIHELVLLSQAKLMCNIVHGGAGVLV